MPRADHDELVTYTYDLNFNEFAENTLAFSRNYSGGLPSLGGAASGGDRRRNAIANRDRETDAISDPRNRPHPRRVSMKIGCSDEADAPAERCRP